MSYDVMFLRREPGQTWDEALRAAEWAAERAGVAERGPAHLPDEAVWSAIVTEARRIVGDVSVFVRETGRALDHVPTGIELSYSVDGANISVPYWYSGDEAGAVLAKMYELGEVIERHTELRGYDPQAELPLAEARQQVERGVAAFDRVAIALGRLRRDPR
jgi:hypothetical protein